MKSKLFKHYEREFEQSEFSDRPNLKEGWIQNKMKRDLEDYLWDVRNKDLVEQKIERVESKKDIS